MVYKSFDMYCAKNQQLYNRTSQCVKSSQLLSFKGFLNGKQLIAWLQEAIPLEV